MGWTADCLAIEEGTLTFNKSQVSTTGLFIVDRLVIVRKRRVRILAKYKTVNLCYVKVIFYLLKRVVSFALFLRQLIWL